MKIPAWANLDERAKVYWKQMAPEFEAAGTLKPSTLPEFIKLCKNLSRRDQADDFLTDENAALVDETIFVNASGEEQHAFKPGAYFTISKDLDRIISLQYRTFRPKPEPKGKAKKKDSDGFFEE